MGNPTLPSVHDLFGLSRISLQDLVLTARDRASRHLKVAKTEWHAAVMEEATAVAAEYILQAKEELLDEARRTLEVQSAIEFPQIRKTA
jgi:hypothetical protein